MLKDITLGQYYPGNSQLHKADPRIKIILALLYMVAVFMAKNILGFAVILVFTLSLIMVSRVPLSTVLKAIKPLIFIMAFTAVINIFWTDGEKLLLKFGIIEIYLEGVTYALFMVIRIVSLLAGTSVILTYTTTPIALTDGIERLLAPLKKIKVPVHEFAMMMTIALRFVPTLVEETEKIMSAQKARGADFSTGKLKERAKALIPVLVPLFISAFRRADELATAMECRCYRGGEGRTRMTVLKLKAGDMILLLVFIAFITGLLLLNHIPGISL
ncbi:MAG: energy-coupling factor transporter transmembrane protein EcfT [Ruminococcaceae bacterium]|nr:energy-coupling factor transporter transmembrane protein EcfT [Oscillospiraceae bacterium]